MKEFAQLYETLDTTTSTNEKVAAMVAYFSTAPTNDAAWALFFLTGRRFKRFISSRLLTDWFLAHTGMPFWLFEASYEAVGDTAETIALLLDTSAHTQDLMVTRSSDDWSLTQWIEAKILPLQQLDAISQQQAVTQWWTSLSRMEIFMVNKLLSGSFRVGVSQLLVIRALSQVANLPAPGITHRLMGNWQPTAEFYNQLISPIGPEEDQSRPYPFFLAYPLEQEIIQLGPVTDWQVEWKWDGIRAQLIKRGEQVFLWSRGEDLITERFPEITDVALSLLPDGTVLDGEVLAFVDELPMPFSVLQTRIRRKVLSKKVLAEAPVVFMAYDLLELAGKDYREQPLNERREALTNLIQTINHPIFNLSTAVVATDWSEVIQLREEARTRGVEGFMLKRLNSSYQTGRKKGDWWKWKVNPHTVDAVLIYAQAGHGRRANLFTDYTFAVWQDDALVPVAKAYSGLSNQEIDQLDRWIRDNTIEKFGPVRSVKAEQVFELAFENIAESKRHKSGVALRFPRILRWRTDKPVKEADTLEQLKELIYVR